MWRPLPQTKAPRPFQGRGAAGCWGRRVGLFPGIFFEDACLYVGLCYVVIARSFVSVVQYCSLTVGGRDKEAVGVPQCDYRHFGSNILNLFHDCF